MDGLRNRDAIILLIEQAFGASAIVPDDTVPSLDDLYYCSDELPLLDTLYSVRC
jgi:hypothetical protein